MSLRRSLGTGVLALVIYGLLLLQLASDGLFKRAAAPEAAPRLVPHAFGTRVFAALSASPLSPRFVREATAAIAIDDRDFPTARRLIDTLSPGPARDDLEGALLDAQGDHVQAIAFFVAGGNAARVNATVNALFDSGDFNDALAMQRELVVRLRALGDLESLAHAQWRLAQIESQNGEHAAAMRDYRAALQLEPLSETYLLGAGLESLKQGHLSTAKTYYDKVVALDPASLDGHVGLGRIAARSGDMARAKREAAFVRAHDPSYEGLRTLESEIR